MKNMKAFLTRTAVPIAVLTILSVTTSFGQLVEIINNPNASGNNVFGTRQYAANEAIYTEAEIGAGNFTNVDSAINQIAFNVATVGLNPSISGITIWMKEVPLATMVFTTGTYTTTGYTQVFSGTVNAATPGWISIPLTTPFLRTNGNNLQVLIERKDGVVHTNYTYRSANGNNTGVALFTTRRYNEATPLSGTTSLLAIDTRAQIRLQHVVANDALVQEIYSLGKLPIPFGAPHVIKANVANVGSSALTNVPVTLTITGANSFSSMQTIPSLASGSSVDVTFAAFTPLTVGSDNISVSLPADDYSNNNTKSVVQTVNNNTFSYSYGTVPLAAVGFNNATGDFAVKFNTSVATAISQVSVNFIAGGQPFQVGIWDTTGGNGKPGKLLFSSTIQTSTAGVYVLPVLPAIPIAAGDFFVGVRQSGIVNVSFAYQNEDPIRLNTFFLAVPTGSNTWTDLAPANRFRFMIEPKLQLPIDANITRIVTPAAVCGPGAVSYGAVLSNVGTNTINAGAANITLKIGGANTYTATATNAGNIASGASETIVFNGVNIVNAGTNMDTVFVSLTGDTEQANDTLKTTDISAIATAITTFPAIENAETTRPVLPYSRTVSGSTQLWRVQTGNYSNANQTTALAPHGGTKFFLSDNYSGGNSSGFVSRLSSNCITLPANTGNSCGYDVSFWMSHDNTTTHPGQDSLYVSVSTNNGATWTRLLPGYARLNAGFATPGWERLAKDLSAYAGQTIQLGFESVSKFGNAFGLDDITIAGIASQEITLSPASNNGVALSRQCDEQGWTYYANPALPAAPLFAVNWDPSNTGANAAAKAAAVPTLQLDAAFFAAEDVPGKMATYTMKRYWNIDAGATPLTGPVNIRFFYDSTEKKGVDAAAASFATNNAGTPETGTWFKTEGTDFMGDAVHVTPDGVLNAIPLTNTNTANTLVNGVLYALFDGITSFCGGSFATGVGPSTPLPVTLVNFDARRSGKINQLSWSTSSEINTRRFVVERGTDGRHFTALGELAATGSAGTIRSYSFSDNGPVRGVNYYRLRIVDADQKSKLSAIRSVRNEGSADIAIYPNPVKNTLNLKINADKSDKGELVITDVSGKVLWTKAVTVAAGMNIVPVGTNALAAGAYVLKITLSDDVVIRKFDKQ